MSPNNTVIGRCSYCGGLVTVPSIWMSVVPPVPTCEACGATADVNDKLPVLPMKPAKRYTISTTTSTNIDWFQK